MFKNLKTKNPKQSTFRNVTPLIHNYSRAPEAETSSIDENEAEIWTRCRICGFPCRRDRDVSLKEGSWAGLGVKLGTLKEAGESIGDRVNYGATEGYGEMSWGEGPWGEGKPRALSPDGYYDRTITGGCPSCGSFLYDQDK